MSVDNFCREAASSFLHVITKTNIHENWKECSEFSLYVFGSNHLVITEMQSMLQLHEKILFQHRFSNNHFLDLL